ncbi:uncharacterized protein UTRI_03629 [Ustilago trichophora]|uniref:Uncharacterized protein n=1 Tax=Ustilago trichophora TaxID=86804 RepID=A0A5C3E4K9_9BASI|nr:uncharacterized protein UTRI_03629 [Ustilago trichophora]
MKSIIFLSFFTLATLQLALATILDSNLYIWDRTWGDYPVAYARGMFLGRLSQEPPYQEWGRTFFKEVALPKIRAGNDVKGSDWNTWLNQQKGSAGASGTSERISGAVNEAGSLIRKFKP